MYCFRSDTSEHSEIHIIIVVGHNVDVTLVNDTFRLESVDEDYIHIPLYAKLSRELVELLSHVGAEDWYISLYTSKAGPVVVIGADLDIIVKYKVVGHFVGTPFLLCFAAAMECFAPEELRTRVVDSAAIGTSHPVLQPGCSVSLKHDRESGGTIGCILTDGFSDVILTAGHCTCSMEDCLRDLRVQRILLAARRISPSSIQQTRTYLLRRFSWNNSLLKFTKICVKIKEMSLDFSEDLKKLRSKASSSDSRQIGETILTVVGYGNAPVLGDYQDNPSKLDFSLVKILDTPFSNAFPVYTKRNLPAKPTGATSNIFENQIVFKIGRQTGITVGRVNGVKSEVSPRGYSGYFSEWEVVGENGEPWAARGDSGSCVWDLSGNLIGMVWGSTRRYNTGYVTPIQNLLDSIKGLTGREYRPKTTSMDDKNNLKVSKITKVTVSPELQHAYVNASDGDWKILIRQQLKSIIKRESETADE